MKQANKQKQVIKRNERKMAIILENKKEIRLYCNIIFTIYYIKILIYIIFYYTNTIYIFFLCM